MAKITCAGVYEIEVYTQSEIEKIFKQVKGYKVKKSTYTVQVVEIHPGRWGAQLVNGKMRDLYEGIAPARAIGTLKRAIKYHQIEPS